MPSRIARTAVERWTERRIRPGGTRQLRRRNLRCVLPAASSRRAGGVTSPEELIAAAHSSCYCMQLSGVIGNAGGTTMSLVADAEVSLGPDPAGGFG